MGENQFLIPGLVDTHIHAPQYVFTGTGYDRTLLDWLTTYTFPREAEFASEQIAKDSYTMAVDRSLKSGTTTACYYGTIHVEATKILADIITAFGQRAFIGKVNMDTNSPDFYIERNAQESLNATKLVIDYITSLKNPLITPVITPRFVPSCTSELLLELGQLAKSKNLPIQSHLSETLSEIQWVQELFPKSSSYSEIYDVHGLLNDQTIMAHCVHLSKDERELLLLRNVGISHCAASNFCLSSGVLNVKRLFNQGFKKIGLGTDVAGGYSPSILESIRQSITASKVVHIQSRDSKNEIEPLSLAEAFYMATLGGASVLNLESKIGNFKVGKSLDAILVDMDSCRPIHTFVHDTLADKFEKFIYLGDDRHMKDIFVNGQSIL